VIEAPSLRRLTDLLDRLEVAGYTVLPALAGRGSRGAWSREGLVTEAGRMVIVICVLDASRVDAVLEEVYALVRRQIGIIIVSDVAVIRGERF
jgi:PII-like signaling protein